MGTEAGSEKFLTFFKRETWPLKQIGFSRFFQENEINMNREFKLEVQL